MTSFNDNKWCIVSCAQKGPFGQVTSLSLSSNVLWDCWYYYNYEQWN